MRNGEEKDEIEVRGKNAVDRVQIKWVKKDRCEKSPTPRGNGAGAVGRKTQQQRVHRDFETAQSINPLPQDKNGGRLIKTNCINAL